MLQIHNDNGGHDLNIRLSKLFECMNNESNWNEVSIKVAALNQLYATAIQNISPVVNIIISKIPLNYKMFSEQEYANLVDEIATVKWTNPITREKYVRHNLSFASKYIHFLSKRIIPIYDSYIWIVIIGYLKQNSEIAYSFSAPKSYKEFYSIFIKFKQTFKLNNRSNYEIDKFLWQYGKSMLDQIIKENNSSLDSAKSMLKKRIINQHS